MSTRKKNFYAVARGHKPGLYETWAGPGGAQEQVAGFNGAVYKGFYALEDALEWLEDHGVRVPEHSQPKAVREADRVYIYTDGGVLENPGPGGYGVVIQYGDHRKELSGGYRLTTNNRMELTACIEALRALKKPSKVTIYSDSKYIVDAVNLGWAQKWRANRWRRDNDRPIENADLWAELLDLLQRHEVEFVWVKGHGGKRENERCDQLASQAARGKKLQIDEGYEKANSPNLFDV